MNQNVNKEILCNLEEFIQFKSMFEMLSDVNFSNLANIITHKIFIVKDTPGSEFSEFFKQDFQSKFDVHEISSDNKEIEEILTAFEKPNEVKEDSDLSDQPKKEVARKKFFYLNNPAFTTEEDRKRLGDLVRGISKILDYSSDYFVILRILADNIPQEFIEHADFVFKIPYPSKIQRINILEKLLENLDVHTVDITHLSELTEDKWNVQDLKRLVFTTFLHWKTLNYTEFKSQLKNQDLTDQVVSKSPWDSINKIPLTTEIFALLIQNHQIQPACYLGYNHDEHTMNIDVKQDSQLEKRAMINSSLHLSQNYLLEGLGLSEINSFTSSQLYQYAATNHFEELTVILEKLDQGKKLDEKDRNILADYAFILKDPPNRALLKLTNAKKTIDRIQKLLDR